MGTPFSFLKFNPRSLAGLAHWFSADYGVTLDGSGRAASVLDQSGNNRTLSGQGGGGAGTGQNPSMVAAAQAGRPGFGFTALLQSFFNYTGFNPGNTFMALAVLKGVDAVHNCNCWTAAGAVNHQIVCSSSNGGINCYDGTNLVNSHAQDLSTKFGLVEVALNAGTMSAWYNGVSLAMTTAAGLTGTMTIGSFGQIVNGASYSDMTLCEAMLLTTLPTSNQQLELREYLRAKYNLF